MALPTLDATFASSADLPRKQMLAKWLVSETGETLPSDVLVSGAGTASANGVYTYRGISSGKPYYNLHGYPDSILTNAVYWDTDTWGISDENGTLTYYWSEGPALPWENGGNGWVVSAGESPTPITTEIARSPISNYYSLPERYLWAKIAVAAGGPKTEATYISLPKNYVWSDIYNAISGSIEPHIDWTENVALGHIAAAYRGDTGTPANLATYIDWPWRYKVASIIDSISVCSDNQANLLIDGNVLIKSAGTEPRFSYDLGSFTVSWSGGLWVYDDTSIPITLGTATSEELYPWLAGLGSKICP